MRLNRGEKNVTFDSLHLGGILDNISLPLGPRMRTVNCPAPAPRVSQMNLDWYMARTPCSTPGP